ncbi:MAG: hypothetical protein ACUVV6_02380 [Thermoplasmatota archaeon]
MRRTVEREGQTKRAEVLERVLRGQAMETYIEHRTSEMRCCALCESIGYRRRPMKQVGRKWICLPCWRQMKEILESLDRWEEEVALKNEMDRTIKRGLGASDSHGR